MPLTSCDNLQGATMNTSPSQSGNSGNESTDITNWISDLSIESMERKMGSQKRKGTNETTKPDTGPRRGNRAATVPQHLPKSDLKSYLERLENYGQGVSSDPSSSQQLSRQLILKPNGRRSTFMPQYAARNHGELVLTIIQLPSTAKKADANDTIACVDHVAMITEEVWGELARENSHWQSLQRKRSFPAKKSSTRRRGSGAENVVLRRALQDRGNPE
jgi:hypothetical protein